MHQFVVCVFHSCVVQPCFFVPTCPLQRFPPLHIWPCHVVHSRDFSHPIVVSSVLVLSPSICFCTLWLLWPCPLTLQPKIISLVGNPKIIPCTNFKHVGIIRFWVIVWTDKHTDRITADSPRQTDAAKRFTLATIVSVSNHVSQVQCVISITRSKPPQ